MKKAFTALNMQTTNDHVLVLEMATRHYKND